MPAAVVFQILFETLTDTDADVDIDDVNDDWVLSGLGLSWSSDLFGSHRDSRLTLVSCITV